MARLARLVQGLRSHPLHEIYRIDFATASRAGDCFTASSPNQRWVRNDDKNRVVIGRAHVFQTHHAAMTYTKVPKPVHHGRRGV